MKKFTRHCFLVPSHRTSWDSLSSSISFAVEQKQDQALATCPFLFFTPFHCWLSRQWQTRKALDAITLARPTRSMVQVRASGSYWRRCHPASTPTSSLRQNDPDAGLLDSVYLCDLHLNENRYPRPAGRNVSFSFFSHSFVTPLSLPPCGSHVELSRRRPLQSRACHSDSGGTIDLHALNQHWHQYPLQTKSLVTDDRTTWPCDEIRRKIAIQPLYIEGKCWNMWLICFMLFLRIGWIKVNNKLKSYRLCKLFLLAEHSLVCSTKTGFALFYASLVRSSKCNRF